MEAKQYCSEICGAKCCKVWDGQTKIAQCPKLSKEKLCGFYKERYQENKPFSFLVVINGNENLANCGNIGQMILDGTLPEWIKSQCCYAYPDLLKAYG